MWPQAAGAVRGEHAPATLRAHGAGLACAESAPLASSRSLLAPLGQVRRLPHWARGRPAAGPGPGPHCVAPAAPAQGCTFASWARAKWESKPKASHSAGRLLLAAPWPKQPLGGAPRRRRESSGRLCWLLGPAGAGPSRPSRVVGVEKRKLEEAAGAVWVTKCLQTSPVRISQPSEGSPRRPSPLAASRPRVQARLRGRHLRPPAQAQQQQRAATLLRSAIIGLSNFTGHYRARASSRAGHQQVATCLQLVEATGGNLARLWTTSGRSAAARGPLASRGPEPGGAVQSGPSARMG